MSALRSQQPWWDHMWRVTDPWGWIWMIFMMLLWTVVLVVLVWLAYRIARDKGWLGEGPGSGRRDARAEEILRQRYARGEVDRDTYLQMLEDLRDDRRAA